MGKGKKENARIVLTGGHAGATAYALIQNLRNRRNFDGEIFWIGPSRALEGKRIPTYERNIFPKIGVTFYPIIAGRIQRKFTSLTIPALLKIPIGFIHALILLLKSRPDIVVSFGGFAAYPVVVISWMLRIPVILHEQTITVGRANQYSASFAEKIALARRESKKYFPRNKCVVIGNPISQEAANIRPKDRKSSPPVILITGGSRGSVAINDLVEPILEKLLENFQVVHQTGEYQLTKFKEIRKNLNKNLRSNYKIYGFIEPWKWPEFIRRADLVVSRSGANIVSEIITAKRPALFIPLPFTYMNEQGKNAKFAEQFGIAKVLNQDGLTHEKLLSEIRGLDENWEQIVLRVKDKPSPDIKAADKLGDLVLETLL